MSRDHPEEQPSEVHKLSRLEEIVATPTATAFTPYTTSRSAHTTPMATAQPPFPSAPVSAGPPASGRRSSQRGSAAGRRTRQGGGSGSRRRRPDPGASRGSNARAEPRGSSRPVSHDLSRMPRYVAAGAALPSGTSPVVLPRLPSGGRISGTPLTQMHPLARAGGSNVPPVGTGSSSSRIRAPLRSTTPEPPPVPIPLHMLEQLFDSVRHGNLQALRAVLSQAHAMASSSSRPTVTFGAILNAQERSSKWTPLMLACVKGHTAVVKELIRCGVDVNIRDATRQTALLLASFRGNTNCVEELLKCEDVDVNCQSYKGVTPLNAASYYGHFHIAKELLRHEAIQIDKRNNEGNTALHCASREGHGKIAQLLLEYGGNKDILNHANQTAKALAKTGGLRKIFEESYSFRELFDNDLFTNIEISFRDAAGTPPVKCHRCILKASEYLNQSMVNRQPIVEDDPEAVHVALEWMYGSKPSMILGKRSPDFIYRVFKVARKWNVEELQVYVCDKINRGPTEKVLQALVVASQEDEYRSSAFYLRCLRYLQKHLPLIARKDEWLEPLVADPKHARVLVDLAQLPYRQLPELHLHPELAMIHPERSPFRLLKKHISTLLGDRDTATLALRSKYDKHKRRVWFVHREVLVIKSHYFRAMLTHDFAESGMSVIVMDMSPEALQLLLEFLYNGKFLSASFRVDPFIELYTLAGKFLMRRLEKACVVTIKKMITRENSVDVMFNIANHDVLARNKELHDILYLCLKNSSRDELVLAILKEANRQQEVKDEMEEKRMLNKTFTKRNKKLRQELQRLRLENETLRLQVNKWERKHPDDVELIRSPASVRAAARLKASHGISPDPEDPDADDIPPWQKGFGSEWKDAGVYEDFDVAALKQRLETEGNYREAGTGEALGEVVGSDDADPRSPFFKVSSRDDIDAFVDAAAASLSSGDDETPTATTPATAPPAEAVVAAMEKKIPDEGTELKEGEPEKKKPAERTELKGGGGGGGGGKGRKQHRSERGRKGRKRKV